MKVISFDIESTGLDPVGKLEDGKIIDGSRVTCICTYDFEGKERVFFDTNEKKLLKEFLEFVDENREAAWTGYNIIFFDIPFIYFRAAKHKLLKKGSHIHTLKWGLNKWHNPYVIDLAPIFAKGWKQNRKCQLILKYLNLATKTADGADAITMYEEKNYDELIKYCLNDAKVEYELYKYCDENGMFPPYRI